MSALIPLLLAAAVHEAGHLGAARLLGVPCRYARMRFPGGRLVFDFSRVGYGRELFVRAAGPLCGALTALFAHLAGWEAYAWPSLALSALNCLPLTGFDGGGMLYAALCSACLPDTAAKTCAAVSCAVRIFVWAAAARYALLTGSVGAIGFAAGLVLGGAGLSFVRP